MWCLAAPLGTTGLSSLQDLNDSADADFTKLQEMYDRLHSTNQELADDFEQLSNLQQQQAQPMMRALTEYIVKQKLPSDRLERIRVLEAAPLYEVNQTGLLCRVRTRGNKGSLGVDLQVVVPEALQGTVIAGCHQGAEGHMSVLKTFQKVRDRFYWPGCFLDVQRYLRYCPGCQLNAAVKSKAHITRHIEAL